MQRRQFLKKASLTIASLALGCSLFVLDTKKALAQSPKSRPNVIVLLSDDQGWGDLGFNGNPLLKTPNLDRLCALGVSFTDFHTAPLCTPTRSQLMSGQDALRNGGFCYQFGHEMIRRDVPTLAEIFRANGYRTAMFGKWHLGENYPDRPEDRGFDEVLTFGGAHFAQTPDFWDNDYFDDVCRHNGKWEKTQGYCDDVWFEHTKKFAAESARN